MPVTIHLSDDVARDVLFALGWTIEPVHMVRGDCVYVRPGGQPRADGGRCGPDYLWRLDEALTVALRAMPAGLREDTPAEALAGAWEHLR